MKSIDPATAAGLSGCAAATALAVLVVRRDGGVTALTDHDVSVEFQGFVFEANAGLAFDGLEQTADLAPDHGVLRIGSGTSGFEPSDIRAGHYANARVEIWRVNTDDTNHSILLSVGTLGELTIGSVEIEAEYRSLKHKLAQPTGRLYQKSCDAQLGHARCGVNLAAFTIAAHILSVDGLSVMMAITSTPDAGQFANGTIKIQSGIAKDVSASIRTARIAPGVLELTLWETFPTAPAPGDSVAITAGCDKRFATCRDRFANSDRFAGFPTIPGMDVLTVATRGS
ncbi:MAG: DUF2163 domain-containing protein [Pseudomonadota bacterium]